MTEQAPPSSHATDPSLTLGNITPSPELQQKVGQVIEYFNQEFKLDIDPGGNLQTEPTPEQLSGLKDWHQETSENGIIMPDMDTFTAKTILARALMPQRDENGQIQYLFGKGAGAELSLQGQVAGRDKKYQDVPFRTHSDFEIYATSGDGYSTIPHSDRFRAVFGGQEIRPAAKTKGLSDLPPGYLQQTAETANYGGVDFLVPKLELQFVDKFESTNELVERKLREKTDAEWIAAVYPLDAELIHATIDDFVIAPKTANFQPPAAVAEQNNDILARKLVQRKRWAANEHPQATDKELTEAAKQDPILIQYSQKVGLTAVDLEKLIDSNSGLLAPDSVAQLTQTEAQRQAHITEALTAKHQQADTLLQAA